MFTPARSLGAQDSAFAILVGEHEILLPCFHGVHTQAHSTPFTPIRDWCTRIGPIVWAGRLLCLQRVYMMHFYKGPRIRTACNPCSKVTPHAPQLRPHVAEASSPVLLRIVCHPVFIQCDGVIYRQLSSPRNCVMLRYATCIR